MISQLFVGLVAYVMQTQTNPGIADFRSALLQWLQELHNASDFELLEGYADLRKHWLTSMDEGRLEELLPEFTTMVQSIFPIGLYELAAEIRNTLLFDDAPHLNYPIKDFRVIFSIRWEDGLVSDYCCHPVLRGGQAELTASFLHDLAQVFRQNFSEYLHAPGLDVMHDQAARVFDYEKFDELLKVLGQHVQTCPPKEREAYEQIIHRIQHSLGPSPKVSLPKEKPSALEWLENGGGF